MSYAATAALQSAVFAALIADTQVTTLSGGQVFDALPAGTVPSLYVSLGPEQARSRADANGARSVHEFPVLVVTDAAGFHGAKTLAAAISDALDGADLGLTRGHLVALNFLRAKAQKKGNQREIEIWFRAFIDLQNA